MFTSEFAKRLLNLLLPALLITISALLIAVPALGQNESVINKQSTRIATKQATTANTSAKTDADDAASETDDSSSSTSSMSDTSRSDTRADISRSDTSSRKQAKSSRVHFVLSHELTATEKDKHASFELFPESKPARVPTFNEPARRNRTLPQKDATPEAGEHSAEELAKKLSNPVSSLISFPIQSNFDFGMGPGGSGWRMTMNIQPVIPIALNPKWNLISRTILPIIHQGNVVAAGTGQSGLGDAVQSFFISPNKTEPFIWGVGPVVLIPTATNEFLGSDQLGLGPTLVVLKQQGHWTYGALFNHIWRVAGGDGKPNVNSTFMQPFLNYSTKSAWTYGLNTESTYDWTGSSWSVPIHFSVSKVVRFGKQPISFGGQLRCWANSPTGGPEGCGFRAIVTGIFPKK
jgi:hypothetical protein